MREITSYIILIILITFLGCNKEKADNRNSISEDFENINSTDELFNKNWTYYQQTEKENFIAIDTTNPHSGLNSLRLFATKGNISKSDIANNKMLFEENDIVKISAWFFIQGTDKLDYVFLFDIEEDAVIGASPGIRIAIDADGYLYIDRKKYGASIITQSIDNKIIFPRNKWVELKIEIKLKQNKKGAIKLWQNDTRLIDVENIQTLPKDKLYYIQGTQGTYRSIQIGITATTSQKDLTLFIDDIEIQKTN